MAWQGPRWRGRTRLRGVAEIERAVERLADEELAKFREWFAKFDSIQWDRQMERDAATGKLDALAEEVLADLRKGRAKDL